MNEPLQEIQSLLQELYGAESGRDAAGRLLSLLDGYRSRMPVPTAVGLTQRDAILICYGDQVSEPGQLPLRTLAAFCERRLSGRISAVHILPFYPASSDDGFSVVDYRSVDAALGGWGDIIRLGQSFRLMFDAVINHVSSQSVWFQGFLRSDPRYRDYFIAVSPDTDLSVVVRPRALPLLTTFDTTAGPRSIWTTFSVDQIDLNYRNPEVLLAVVDTLLFYAAQGASFIRLDAIAYLWKEPGTPSINLPAVHQLVRLLRAVLDAVAPHVMLITETNVAHNENISYFGDGYHEAQLVYNFALPPLTLHAFHTGSAATLTRWADTLRLPSRRVTFFNFLASHDGIGLNPARGILSDAEIAGLEAATLAQGGHISYKNNRDGTRSAYELNINYWDALCGSLADEALERKVDRFMAAQAIMLALVGTPGIYFHSLFGLPGWPEGARLTGQNRTINRQKFLLADLELLLSGPGTQQQQVLARFERLLRARAGHPAFDPYGDMQVLAANESVFVVLRSTPDGNARVLCLHNVSDHDQIVPLDVRPLLGERHGPLQDLVTGRQQTPRDNLRLLPYQTLWLAAGSWPAGDSL